VNYQKRQLGKSRKIFCAKRLSPWPETSLNSTIPIFFDPLDMAIKRRLVAET
jgi:hypothetical protein